MAARKKIFGGHKGPPEPDQSEVRWLISYSDFMMQLVCLFILLYSVSSLDEGKAQAVSAARRQQIGLGEPPRIKPPTPAETKGEIDVESERNLTGAREEGKAPIPRGLSFRVREVPDGWLVYFPGPIFKAGSAELDPAVLPDLDKLGSLLRSYVATVVITGYAGTDPEEKAGGDPLALSQARAATMWTFLTRRGFARALDPRSVIAAGKGATEDPQKARRVEILMRVK